MPRPSTPPPTLQTPKPLPFSPRTTPTATTTTSSLSPSITTSAPTLPRKFRPALLAISIALITATGAYYGASLKTEHQAKSQVKHRQESSLDERLDRLKGMKGRMEVERKGLVGKIEEVEKRRREREVLLSSGSGRGGGG